MILQFNNYIHIIFPYYFNTTMATTLFLNHQMLHVENVVLHLLYKEWRGGGGGGGLPAYSSSVDQSN
jgi:hypothetical protein